MSGELEIELGPGAIELDLTQGSVEVEVVQGIRGRDGSSVAAETGWYTGGDLSVGTPTTNVQVDAGTGTIVDAATDPENPVITIVTWVSTQIDGEILTPGVNIGQIVVSLGASTGAGTAAGVIETRELGSVDEGEFHTLIQLGEYLWNGIDVEIADGAPYVGYNHASNIAFGLLKNFEIRQDSGNVMGPSQVPSSPLKIEKTAGKTIFRGGNAHIDRTRPNIVDDVVLDPFTWVYVRSIAPGPIFVPVFPPVDEIDPSKWDPLDGTLNNVSEQKWTIQPLIYFPATQNGSVFYGQEVFNSRDEAILSTNIPTEFLASVVRTGVLRGFLVVRGGAADLNLDSDREFVVAPRLGFLAIG